MSFRLNIAAGVRFTVAKQLPGRRGRGGKCVKPTRANRRARKCTRSVAVRGSFSRAGTAGANEFRFSARLRGRKLAPGRYRLVARPTAGGKAGRKVSAPFRIVR